MAKIAILCDSNPLSKPRPARLIEMLSLDHQLYIFGKDIPPQPKQNNPTFFSFPPSKSASERTAQEEKELRKKCYQKDFHSLIFTPNRLILRSNLLAKPNLELLIVEDITLLPFALEYKSHNPHCKTIIDLREFYPLEYENNQEWLETLGAFFTYLCQTYLPKVDFALTVSRGLAQKYKEAFNLSPTLFLSLPPYHHLTPSTNTTLELIYHGLISPDRESENLLEIAKGLKEGIHLNLMILSNQPKFLQDFKAKASMHRNITLHPPVPLQSIIPFCNRFDLGLITLQPNSFNNTHALPNKFFEYIQSRLGVISTPLPSITPMIHQYNIGKCSQSFKPDSIIHTLNSLTQEEIHSFKQNAHQASQTLNTQTNQTKILQIINTLLKEQRGEQK